MANSQYDLDLSGGLMPQIQALLAPPLLEDISKEKRTGLALHPYYRRPGRGHNHDSCDSCKEGGELICCDSCPASFHLQCHDPPLEEADLPVGLWNCHSCRIQKTQETEQGPIITINDEDIDSDSSKNGKRSRNSVVSSSSQTGSSGNGKPENILKRRRTNNSEDVDVESTEKIAEKEDSAEKMSFFGSLIKVAASMNPQQYELPPELVEPISFPGSSKFCPKKGAAGTKKKSHELDNGLVPLPLRACFYCSKSCKKAPMVACDFCPLVFHLDCLNPPLVCMPVGKWMCPNHPQNIEYQLLRDSRLTERVKLWSYLQRPIDHETVKINFLRKVNRKNPAFRRKVALPSRLRMLVPQIIKDQYKHPPLLPPHLQGGQANFWSAILPETCRTEVTEHSAEEDEVTSEPSENNQLPKPSSGKCDEELTEDIISNPEDDVKEKKETGLEQTTIEEGLKKIDLNPAFEKEFRDIEDQVKNYLATLRRALKERHLKVFMEQLSVDILSSLDDETMKTLAVQRVQELILNPESRSLTIFPYPCALGNTKDSCTSAAINQPWLQQTLSSDSENSQSNVFPRQPRAFLCPLSSAYPPAPIYNKRLTIGTGADMDLTLTSYASCKYVSGHHATIFYDEMSKHFELLNYSEHGTVVDNIVYCCDVGTEEIKSETEDAKEKKLSFQGLDELLKRSANENKKKKPEPLSLERNEGPHCGCRTGISSLSSNGKNGNGWEGTALLTHGSHMKLGCIQFILCISNTNEKPRFIHQ